MSNWRNGQNTPWWASMFIAEFLWTAHNILLKLVWNLSERKRKKKISFSKVNSFKVLPIILKILTWLLADDWFCFKRMLENYETTKFCLTVHFTSGIQGSSTEWEMFAEWEPCLMFLVNLPLLNTFVTVSVADSSISAWVVLYNWTEKLSLIQVVQAVRLKCKHLSFEDNIVFGFHYQ